MDDFIPFDSQEYFMLLALLLFARGMDFLSTWVATPHLVLEGNPIAKWLGGPDAETRASVMVSTLLGFIILRQAIALPGLSAGRGDALREMMSAALQSQIDASSPLRT